MIRPDGRCFVRARELPAALTGEVYCTVDEADADTLTFCERLGFVVNRRESRFVIPITRVESIDPPLGFDVMRADEVDLDRVRVLDDALRQDVPGTDGWRWDEAGFREEFDGAFDPATYLIAVELATGEYAGLVRVWRNPSGPRLGMVGVLPQHRRRGVARALLAQAFAVLHEGGEAEVSTEIDDANEASRALLLPLGARRSGGSIELVRRDDARA